MGGVERRKRKVTELDDQLARTSDKEEKGVGGRLAMNNCYVESHSNCNSQVGVQERKVTRLKVGRGDCRIGLASGGTPFWFWAVSSLGTVLWIDTPEERVARCETGSESWARMAIKRDGKLTKNRGSKKVRISFTEPQSWLERPDVDVVLFDGGLSPGPSHPVWQMASAKVVCWIGGRQGAGPCDKTGTEWKTTVMKLEHDELGGVTTLVSMIHVAERVGAQRSRPFVDCWRDYIEGGLEKTTMSGVLDPTVHGTACPIPKRYEPGVHNRTLMDRKLNWKRDRGQEHVVPCVFSRTDWVRRRLTSRELAVALDFPAELHKQASVDELDCWINEIKVPFKGRVQVAHSLRGWFEDEDQDIVEGAKKQTHPDERERENYQYDLVGSKESRMTETEALYSVPDSEEGVGSLNVEERREDRNLKATKSDDAEIPTYLWDDRICEKLGIQEVKKQVECVKALEVIRKGALRYWKRLVCSDFWRWWRYQRFYVDQSADPSLKERTLRAGLSALSHASQASWWDWDKGSSPFFWRMPDAQWLREMRDGIAPMWIGDPPSYRRRQKANPDEKQRSFEKKKLDKVRQRGYIGPTNGIKSLTSFFSVPKGENDIRMVYDGTKSGLNASLFAPWFGLGNVTSMLRTVESKTWSADNDFGEMFLNFWLHPDLRTYTGIDITDLFPEELKEKFGRTRLWEAWTRCAMGLTTSPYQATQNAQRVKRIIFGDRLDPTNVFGWVDVRINLPGDPDYDPSVPWISKIRENGDIAADVHPYVDDLRETAPTEEEAWLAASKMAKGAAYFGLQDAARKRRAPSKTPGAWAGAVVGTKEDGQVFKTVSQERWNKTRAHVETLKQWAESKEKINRKELERVRGFLVYVSLTFDTMVPYLKGIHHTLESWRDDRNVDGWRLPEKDRRKRKRDEALNFEGPPKEVSQAPRFKDDVFALAELTKDETPPCIPARPTRGAKVAIIFGDASGEGFGSSLWLYGSTTVETEHGLWTRQYGGRSSNYRELYNLVLRLETMVKDGTIPKGSEVFMFTDNSTAESAFFKGTSSSPLLFELVLRTKRLEMLGKVFVRVIWVAGTRMIEQGTDGLSRGDLMTGVMAGGDMLMYVPLNKSAEERQPGLVDWLKDCAPLLDWKELGSKDWFDKAFDDDNFIWLPPPALADVAVDQLCEARHIRTRTGFIFACPALMTNRWRKKLGKVADCVFTVPVGSELWNKSQHEPLIVAFVCPFLYRRPWQVKQSKSLLDQVDRELQVLWSSSATAVRNRLRQLWEYKGDE